VSLSFVATAIALKALEVGVVDLPPFGL